jgi:hypothetical protein
MVHVHIGTYLVHFRRQGPKTISGAQRVPGTWAAAMNSKRRKLYTRRCVVRVRNCLPQIEGALPAKH